MLQILVFLTFLYWKSSSCNFSIHKKHNKFTDQDFLLKNLGNFSQLWEGGESFEQIKKVEEKNVKCLLKINVNSFKLDSFKLDSRVTN